MASTLGMITFDCTDPGPLATWWAEQTDGRIVQENDGWFYIVALPDIPVRLGFQKVADPTPGKNRVHLDLVTSDLDAEVRRLVGAGAKEIGGQDMGTFRWVTLADPDGNLFCVSGQH
ncbi:VOC family protein [Rhodococcus sp. Z13]|uniref:VOC family protein n=1 Tax=Rhodococcus sacchari TaxID=2962047 RepID=A0ACD4DHP3_9NOCA|nr:VOC family protein [Rhodococcus sp. Z13]UYP19584.1 VOC family protein [Rhodococcus sp. Z13]